MSSFLQSLGLNAKLPWLWVWTSNSLTRRRWRMLIPAQNKVAQALYFLQGVWNGGGGGRRRLQRIMIGSLGKRQKGVIIKCTRMHNTIIMLDRHLLSSLWPFGQILPRTGSFSTKTTFDFVSVIFPYYLF
jgi:hypothetical protein